LAVLLASDYPFLDIVWTMLVFFLWVIWFWILISILGDVFRRHDISGWGKAAWTVFMIIAPFLGVLVYMIANGQGMAERSVKTIEATAATAGPATEIATAKQLLDTGAITQEEYEAIKRKATS
jgi:putative oligomerization/nucleic acid binding protein/phospholipase D-like protein